MNTPPPLSLSQDEQLFQIESDFFPDEDIFLSITPRHETFKKLEVANSKTVNYMAKIYNLASFLALGMSSIVIILAHFKYSDTIQFFNTYLATEITIYIFPNYFDLIDSVLTYIAFLYSILLTFCYCFILFRVRESGNIVPEQYWVIVLLCSTVIYLIPYEATIRIQRVLGSKDDPRSSWIRMFISLRLIAFSFIQIGYIWFVSHCYKFLRRDNRSFTWRFYISKLSILAVLCSYKLIFLFRYNILFSDVPLMSFLSFLRLYGEISVWPTLGVISVSLLTLIELFVLTITVKQVLSTFQVLKKSDYMKYRSKILGFRFVLHQQLVFNLIFNSTFLLLLFGMPLGAQITEFALRYPENPGEGSYFDSQYAPFGLYVSLLAFGTIEAYSSLPADTRLTQHVIPWTEASSLQTHIPTPIIYRREEPREEEISLLTNPNCFIMQTNIELFNLSWFAYYYDTPKEKSINIGSSAKNLKIIESLFDQVTDTKVIVAVAKSTRKVVFAFKGTSSTQNLLTDLKVNQKSLSSLITESEYHERTESIILLRDSKKFRKARVHAGFADSYATVRKSILKLVKEFIGKDINSFYFTGHSLGGALATLSSLDVRITLGVDSKNLTVASFGSPRVGNRAFQELYDYLVPGNWRFIAGGDLISRLPKIGYSHVGKRVVLTSTGDMYIDPNALEVLFWYSQSASIVHHRKSCYLLALKSWCNNRGDYEPNLWPFPVSRHDTQRFQSTFRKTSTQNSLLSSYFINRNNFGNKEDRAARIQMYADAIDELIDVSEFQYHEIVLNRWEQLISKSLYG